MPSILPPVLAPYIERCLLQPSQTIVTSVIDASANWLVIRLVWAAIHGFSSESLTGRNLATTQQGSYTVLVSFLRSSDLWIEIGKKVNLDIAALIASKKLAYIDGLTGGIDGTSTNSLKSLRPKSHSLQDILTSITSAKNDLVPSATVTDPSGVVILDGIDFVLASQPEITTVQMSQFLLTLQEIFANVILTVSSDSPLLHNTDTTSSPLELNHGILVRVGSHQSSTIMQLRPLDTGSAKDVSGIIRISKGGSSSWTTGDDGEWLYQLKGDGSVRVWARGALQ